MPYIPPQNRPAIDAAVDAVAVQIADTMAVNGETAGISEHFREAFLAVARRIAAREQGDVVSPATAAEKLADAIVEAARGYNQKGGWLGELNYAITTLIQAVPYKMVEAGAWTEHLRYWLYAETVGALVCASYDMHAEMGGDWVGMGLAGVFEDIKDEYKRRVNVSYEAVQILKSGDCYDMVPFRTQLVATTVNGVEGYTEVILPKQEPKAAAWERAGEVVRSA